MNADETDHTIYSSNVGELTSEALGIPPDIRILWQTDEKVFFCEIPMHDVTYNDVSVDSILSKVLEKNMDAETQHRQYNGQLSPGIIAQVVDEAVDIKGELFLCEGFHRMDVQVRKGSTSFFAELRLGYTYDQMLALRIVSATGHRSVELPRIVDWVTKSWNISPWSKRLSIMQAFALVAVPNVSGKEIKKDLGLTDDDIKNIKEWVVVHCEAWKKNPRLIMSHLDLARKVAPDLIPRLRMGEKVKSLSPAQLRTIANSLPGEMFWDLQRTAADIATRQSLNEATTHKMALALGMAGSPEEVANIINTDWSKRQIIRLVRHTGEAYKSNEISSKDLFERLWALEIENAELLVNLATAKRGFVSKKDRVEIKPTVTPDNAAAGNEGTKPEKLHVSFNASDKLQLRRLNKSAGRALERAHDHDYDELNEYFETYVQEPLKKMLSVKFGFKSDIDYDDVIEEMWKEVEKSIGHFQFSSLEIPHYAQLSGWLNRIAVNIAVEKDLAAKKRAPNVGTGQESKSENSKTEGTDAQTLIEQLIISKVESQELKVAILNLSRADQRRVVIMKYILGYSTDDIAFVLDKQEGIIREQLMHAEHNLQEALKS